jgi:hypothetical protein
MNDTPTSRVREIVVQRPALARLGRRDLPCDVWWLGSSCHCDGRPIGPLVNLLDPPAKFLRSAYAGAHARHRHAATSGSSHHECHHHPHAADGILQRAAPPPRNSPSRTVLATRRCALNSVTATRILTDGIKMLAHARGPPCLTRSSTSGQHRRNKRPRKAGALNESSQKVSTTFRPTQRSTMRY